MNSLFIICFIVFGILFRNLSRRLEQVEKTLAAREKELANTKQPAEQENTPLQDKPEVQAAPPIPISPPPPPAREEHPITPGKPIPSDWSNPNTRPAAEKLETPTFLPLNWINNYFSNGNIFIRSGLLIVFCGIAFLLKYASQHITVPLELRLLGVAACGTGLTAFGWIKRNKRPSYAVALQGGGIGIIYMVLFASFRLYQLLPGLLTFSCMSVLGVLSAVLSIRQDSRALAILGIIGGFAAPILASTGSGSHVQLFSYYAILNIGILTIAWFKQWRSLNLIGFAFTYVIGSIWGVTQYHAYLFPSTQPFLIIFFIQYLLIAFLFAQRSSDANKKVIDNTLFFGNPFCAFILQASLVHEFEYGLAWSCIVLGALYMSLFTYLYRQKTPRLQHLTNPTLALGVLFSTLSIAYTFEPRVTAAIWSLEGALLLWVWTRQYNLLGRFYAQFLQLAAALFFIYDISFVAHEHSFLNSRFAGMLMIALAALTSAWLLHSAAKKHVSDQWTQQCWLAYGSSWLIFGFLIEFYSIGLSHNQQLHAAMLLFSVLAASYYQLAAQLKWRNLKYAAIVLISMTVLTLPASFVSLLPPFADTGWLAWPVTVACSLWLLYRSERDELPLPTAHAQHVITVLVATYISGRQLMWHLEVDFALSENALWSFWILTPIAATWSILLWKRWPVSQWSIAYNHHIAGALCLLSSFWIIASSFQVDGGFGSFYFPFMTPYDLVVLFTLYTLYRWYKHIGKSLTELHALAITIMTALCFISANALLLRTIHHWGNVAFSWPALFESSLTQTSLSIFWSMIGMGTVLLSSYKKWRVPWLCGAALMIIVIAKLFLLDLSNTGTIARIISFLSVGSLMVLVGYFSPLPSEDTEEHVRGPDKPA